MIYFLSYCAFQNLHMMIFSTLDEKFSQNLEKKKMKRQILGFGNDETPLHGIRWTVNSFFRIFFAYFRICFLCLRKGFLHIFVCYDFFFFGEENMLKFWLMDTYRRDEGCILSGKQRFIFFFLMLCKVRRKAPDCWGAISISFWNRKVLVKGTPPPKNLKLQVTEHLERVSLTIISLFWTLLLYLSPTKVWTFGFQNMKFISDVHFKRN